MLQFFLHTFGEGITNLYLRPYNEKIWKFDPSFMDLQMVERIPKPPKEDILRSASGDTVDGYLHQLYFYYPIDKGIFALVQSLIGQFTAKVRVCVNHTVEKISPIHGGGYRVGTNRGDFFTEKIVSTMPANELCQLYDAAPEPIRRAGERLSYNSIAIAIARVSKDLAGDNFAFMVADKDVIFHRVSKIDFLGASYRKNNVVTYMCEVTYRKGDIVSNMPDEELLDKVREGLRAIKFVDGEAEFLSGTIKRFDYAYVVYDLTHKENMKIIREFFLKEGVFLHGRFGDFEYLNMDAVLEKSLILNEKFRQII
jgi:protoporphyrinogen oxidase